MGQELRREAFADEQAWIAYQQNLARIAREEALKRVQESHARRQKRPMASRRIQLAYKRMRVNERRNEWKKRDPEGFRAHKREEAKRLYWKDPQRAREYARLWKARKRADPKKREEVRLQNALWIREHPDRARENNRKSYATSQERRAVDPEYDTYVREKHRQSVARYLASHRGQETSARAKERRANQREEINARRREQYRAKKQAK